MKDKKIIFFIVLALGTFALIGISLKCFPQNPNYLLYSWDGQNYQEQSDDKNLCSDKRETNEIKADIDSDGEDEKAFIEKNIAYLKKKGKIIWQTNPEFKAENILFADIDNDRKIDILVSLWKTGKYGTDLPFWLKENINDWGNHFFIYEWQEGGIRLFWGSSTIDAPIREMVVGDVNEDGKNELIVLEGNYDRREGSYADYLTIWHWNEWSLFNEFRSNKGRFSELMIKNFEGKKYVCLRSS